MSAASSALIFSSFGRDWVPPAVRVRDSLYNGGFSYEEHYMPDIRELFLTQYLKAVPAKSEGNCF